MDVRLGMPSLCWMPVAAFLAMRLGEKPVTVYVLLPWCQAGSGCYLTKNCISVD